MGNSAKRRAYKRLSRLITRLNPLLKSEPTLFYFYLGQNIADFERRAITRSQRLATYPDRTKTVWHLMEFQMRFIEALSLKEAEKECLAAELREICGRTIAAAMHDASGRLGHSRHIDMRAPP